MVDFNKVLSGLTQSSVAAGLAGGLAGGALTGALTSKKGRKTAANLLKLGGVAAIGGLAWNAYRNYQQQNSDRSAADMQAAWQDLPEQGFDVQKVDARHAGGNSLLIIRAMVTAAMSDGHIDSAEHMRIFEHAEQLPLSNEDKATLFDELRNPQPVTAIVAGAHDPAIAVEIYAASLLAIDELTYEGQTYLRRLADLLKLPPQLVDAVHAEANANVNTEGAYRAA